MRGRGAHFFVRIEPGLRVRFSKICPDCPKSSSCRSKNQKIAQKSSLHSPSTVQTAKLKDRKINNLDGQFWAIKNPVFVRTWTWLCEHFGRFLSGLAPGRFAKIRKNCPDRDRSSPAINRGPRQRGHKYYDMDQYFRVCSHCSPWHS